MSLVNIKKALMEINLCAAAVLVKER